MSNFHQPSGGSSNVHQPSFAANTPEPKSSEYLVLTRRDFDTLSDMNLQFFLNNTELHKRNEQLQKRNQELQQEIKNHAELQKRNQQLQEEIMRLRAELTLSQQNPAYGLGSSPKRSPSSCSIGPSDSISQRPSRSTTPIRGIRSLPGQGLGSRTSVRPANLPFAVFWCKEDCSKDTAARPTEQNPSRPPMNQAIRYNDGSTVPTSHYNAIRHSGNRFVNELFDHHRKSGSLEHPTMSCLKKLYPKAWQKAILEFEKEHLVLTYCSGNWKAEQILGNIIRGRKKPVSDKNGTSTLKRKRGLSTGSPKQASKKQEKKGSENSPDDTGTSHKNEADDEHTTSQTSLVCQCE